LRGQTEKWKKFKVSITFLIRMLKTISAVWQLFFELD